MLTPQAIKDQEFQVKFRGYDAIEVKSYLEFLAEDFFELLEQNRVYTEEAESFAAELELLKVEKEKFENELRIGEVSRDESEAEVQEECSRKDEEIGNLTNQIVELQTAVTQLEGENSTYRDKIAGLEEELSSGSDAIIKEQDRVEGLQNELQQVEGKYKGLEKEGVDFKTTIVAAQNFADSLRESSEQDALSTIEQAKVEVEKIRIEAREELAHLPKKIEELQQKKIQVRNELKAILDRYMEGLDASPEVNAAMEDDDLSDLFESIQLPDGEIEDLDDTTFKTESS